MSGQALRSSAARSSSSVTEATVTSVNLISIRRARSAPTLESNIWRNFRPKLMPAPSMRTTSGSDDFTGGGTFSVGKQVADRAYRLTPSTLTTSPMR